MSKESHGYLWLFYIYIYKYIYIYIYVYIYIYMYIYTFGATCSKIGVCKQLGFFKLFIFHHYFFLYKEHIEHSSKI